MMSILSEYSLWFVLLCLLLGAIYSFVLYYRNKNIDFNKISLIVLSLLRGLAISLIAFLLLAPMFKFTVKHKEKPLIILAIDNSESIVSGKDSLFYKNDFIPRITDFMNSFSDKYDIQPYIVGDKDQLWDFKNGSFSFSAKSTNLASIFDNVSSFFVNRNVGAMVLMSDGIYNVGTNPFYKTQKVNFPVYTVGLGDNELQTDLLIAGIVHNKQTYKGNYFPVEIKVAANKLSGKNARLTVEDASGELFSRNISFPGNSYFETIKLTLEAKEKGMHQYRVNLSEIEGEITYKNNHSSFYIEVIDAREKILILYDAPHPDVSAIKQALETSDKYQIEAVNPKDFKGSLDQYSLIILHQLPSKTQNIPVLISQIQKGGLSALYILGSQSNLNAFNGLNSGVMLTQNKNLFNDALPSFNDNFTSFTFSEETVNMLKNFPPLHVFFGDYRLSVASNVFMYQKINNITTQYPLVVFNEVNGAKVGVVAGDGLWQWRLYNYLYARNHDAFNEIVNKMALYLSVKSDRSFFRVFGKNIYDENAPVEFIAELYNESYELINEPDITMVVTGENEKKYSSWFSKVNNAYSMNMGQLPVGNYSWLATVKTGNKSYQKSGAFSVREMMLESMNMVADFELMKNIAKETKGNFYTVDKLQQLRDDIENNDEIKTIVSYEKKYNSILNSAWYFGVIILLFGIEWFLRKWNGGY